MRLTRLEVSDFRSYHKMRWELEEITVFLGANGSGKTNVIEAIALLSTGMSMRARKIEEMIAWEEDLASVTGIIDEKGETNELVVILTRGIILGRKVAKRRYLIDGIPRVKAKFVTRLPTVMFRPEDMRLVEGSPARRRQYLDETLAVMSQDYARSSLIYASSLTQRNRLLDNIREGKARREQLSYWDMSLIKHGNIITEERRKLIDFLTNDFKVTFGEYIVEYDHSTISTARLNQYANQEILVGHTLVGPHKDDLIIKTTAKRDLLTYGSRGEQRLGVLYLKLGALAYIEARTQKKAIILLDDVFSELDETHRKEILELITERQSIITTAEEDVVALLPDKAKIIRTGEKE